MKFAENARLGEEGPAGDAEKVLGDRHRAGCRGSHDRPGGWRRIPRPSDDDRDDDQERQGYAIGFGVTCPILMSKHRLVYQT